MLECAPNNRRKSIFPLKNANIKQTYRSDCIQIKMKQTLACVSALPMSAIASAYCMHVACVQLRARAHARCRRTQIRG